MLLLFSYLLLKKCFLSYTWLSSYQKLFLETLFVLQVAQTQTVNKNHKYFQQNLLPAIAFEYKKIRLCIYQKYTSLLVIESKYLAYLLAKNTFLKILSCFLFLTYLII